MSEKDNIYEKEKEDEIYDVLKDNPRWDNEKPLSPPPTLPPSYGDNETEIGSPESEKGPALTSEYLYEDKQTEELINSTGDELQSEDYLTKWKNEAVEEEREREFQNELRERRDPGYRFEDNSTRHITVSLVIIILLILAFTVYAVGNDVVNRLANGGASSDSQSFEFNREDTDEEIEATTDEEGKYDIEGVAEKVRPSIVDVNCYSSEAAYKSNKPTITGSGIIMSSDGYIVTNSHIIENSKYFTAVTNTGKEYVADITGSDIESDIAVLKIDATGLTAAEIGDSAQLKVGQSVVAIGNPAGLSGTVTNGIISAVNRKIKSEDTGYEMTCIQTNAAISPGNSGGALVDMYGKVIGITSSKYINASYEGLGFAITINQAMPVITELASGEKAQPKLKMGISFMSVNSPESREHYTEDNGIELDENFCGLLVTSIKSDFDISQAELEVNDFITAIDGQKTEGLDDVTEIINSHQAGDVLTADCVRYFSTGNSTEFSIEFTLQEVE